MLPRVPDPDLRKERVKMYADLAGNRKKYRIKSRYDNITRCEGRVIYDCFVLNEKKDAIYYHGKQGVLKTLSVMTSPVATSSSQTAVIITTEAEAGHKFVYKVFDTIDDKPEVAYGTALSGWNDITSGGTITVTGDNAYVMVAEVDAANKPVGAGTATINVA